MFGLFRKRPNFDYINWIRNQPVESTSYLLALIVNELSNRFHESKLYKTKYSFIESDIGMFEILMTMAYMLKNDFPLSKSKKSLDFDYWMNIRSNIFIDSFKNATIDIYGLTEKDLLNIFKTRQARYNKYFKEKTYGFMEKDILEYIAKALEIKTPYPLELEPLDTTTYSGEYTYIEEVIKDIELKTYETLVLLLVKFAKMNTSN